MDVLTKSESIVEFEKACFTVPATGEGCQCPRCKGQNPETSHAYKVGAVLKVLSEIINDICDEGYDEVKSRLMLAYLFGPPAIKIAAKLIIAVGNPDELKLWWDCLLDRVEESCGSRNIRDILLNGVDTVALEAEDESDEIGPMNRLVRENAHNLWLAARPTLFVAQA